MNSGLIILNVFFTIFIVQKVNYSVIGSNETESDFRSITALIKK
jgi:hypothetical protein